MGKFSGRFPFLINLDPSQEFSLQFARETTRRTGSAAQSEICLPLFFSFFLHWRAKWNEEHKEPLCFPAVFFKALLDGKQDVPASRRAQSVSLKNK